MYKLSPSKAHRFLNCTKSLEFDVPFTETPQTVRGNILHQLAQMQLANQDFQDFIQEHKINEYELYLIDSYVSACWSEKHRLGEDAVMTVEEKKPIVIYNNSINLVVDCLIVNQTEASILDLKSGNGDIEAEDNEQLYFYAYMVALQHTGVNKFSLSIFQKGKMKTIVVSRKEVFDFFIERFDTFEKIANKELEYNPSDKACKFCPIKDTCLARARWIIGGKK
jgi:CRISPR/Cas system-associated exonuclease Cas4 (RecB family)